ncbi:MAG: thioredoxin [Chloroflexota bacterium]|nr:thioredoxin [Chloroflexota bacterium]
MADPAAEAGSTTREPPMGADAAAPVSVLTCAECGKRNRIRPSATGAPHCGSCGKPLPWLVDATDDTFDVEARASVAVLVDLWAPWCGPCRIVGPIVEELSREFAGRLKVLKVNVDDNQRTAMRFDARSIPTLVVLRDGRPVDRFVGALPKSDLRIRLTPHLLRRA